MPRTRFVALFVLSLSCPSVRAQDEGRPPTSLYDPRLGEVRRAAVSWDNRRGPTRGVIDQVAIVPDVPSFFQAIAAWDDVTWFPILIEDAELTPKFLRAFRPAKVVRFPSRAPAIAPKALWDVAVYAAGAAWEADQVGPPEIGAPRDPQNPLRSASTPKGDRPPLWLAPTPPGVVVTHPESPALAGAVALAAGRFQPLLRWEPQIAPGARIGEEEARRLTLGLETALADVTPRFANLRDDCDFLTLAAPYPDRFVLGGGGLRAGVAALDDFIGRDRETLRRWAYTGRLMGDPSESVYRAMCSLFLQPQSAFLFDTYDEADPDFQPYSMRFTPRRLPRDLKVTVVAREKADAQGWHRALDPINPYGLVIVNSSGASPRLFTLASGTLGTAGDVPPTVPAVVIVNHSTSAMEPSRADTFAGAWLAGGAYIYFGSLNEPYIQSFHPPSLVAALLAEELPIAAAVRMTMEENPIFGGPWRLHLLGDPLFRLDARAARTPRHVSFAPTESWPAYGEEPPPAAGASDADRLAWLAKATLIHAARGEGAPTPAMMDALAGVRRDALAPPARPILDGLRIDALPRSGERAPDILARLAAIPPAEAGPRVTRAVLSARVAALRRAIDTRDWNAALATWGEIHRSDLAHEMKVPINQDMGAFAERVGRLTLWRNRVRDALQGAADSLDSQSLRQELGRGQGGKPAPDAKAPGVGRSIRR